MPLVKRRKIYNDRECWETAMSWGAAFTYRKLAKWHIGKHGFGSAMGPRWAMWRYACQNPEECFPAYKDWYFLTAYNGTRSPRDPDPNITFRDFLEDCKAHGNNKSVMARRTYKKFCEKHGLKP